MVDGGWSERFENSADKRTSSATATADAPLTVCFQSVCQSVTEKYVCLPMPPPMLRWRFVRSPERESPSGQSESYWRAGSGESRERE